MEEQIQTFGEVPQEPQIELSVGSIISNGFAIGFKYFFQLIGSFFLYLISIWIPYVNVGTTIGIYGLIVKMSKGEDFSIGEIFSKKYRDFMPDFLLLLALVSAGVGIAYGFVLIPGLILSISWMLSYYYLLDKNMGVFESIKASSKSTYGYKWDIFGGLFILMLIWFVVVLIIWLIFRTSPELDYSTFDEFNEDFTSPFPFQPSFSYGLNPIGVFLFIVSLFVFAVIISGALAHIYKELSKRQ
ncbi:MAG: YciC family protein [Ignavibacteria bacterium]|nr:YciC family protein [Ignavibacteria bacterium]